jgi:DNA (cytosine-5)-methyltransferase 1
VEGLLTSNGGKSVAELVRQFVKMGYRTRLEKLNFAAYGLPQARKRVLLIGNRIGLDFALPQSEFSFDAGKHKCKGNLRLAPCIDEALAGLGVTSPDGQRSKYSSALPVNEYDTLMRIGNVRNDVSLHFSTVSEKMLNVIAKLAPGETMKDLPEQYWHESYKRRAFRRVMDGTPTEKRGGAPSGIKRLKGELNALTITSASPRELIHPVEHRPLTLREAARLQSFPDAFEFCGNSQSVARQIGNAFPPLVAASIARHIGKLDGTFGAGGGHKPRLPGALIGYRLTDAFGMSPALENTKTLLDFVQYEQEAFVFLQEREKVA